MARSFVWILSSSCLPLSLLAFLVQEVLPTLGIFDSRRGSYVIVIRRCLAIGHLSEAEKWIDELVRMWVLEDIHGQVD